MKRPSLFLILFSFFSFVSCGKSGLSPSDFNFSSNEGTAGGSESGSGSGADDPFDPSKISKLSRWYSMKDLNDLEDEKLVPESKNWIDRSGNYDISKSGSVSGEIKTIKHEILESVKVLRVGFKQRLRLSVSKDTNLGENSSFTSFFVISRDSTPFETKYNTVLSHNDNGSTNRGLYFGWVGDEVFRFSISGSTGKSFIDTKVEAPGRPKLEIWTGMQDRESTSNQPGMSLHHNGKLVAKDSSMTGAGDPSPTFQILGSKSNTKASGVLFAEILFYEKALTDSERCSIHHYLSELYEIELSEKCEI